MLIELAYVLVWLADADEILDVALAYLVSHCKR